MAQAEQTTSGRSQLNREFVFSENPQRAMCHAATLVALPSDSGIALAYTWKRKRIAFVELTTSVIAKGLIIAQ